MNEVDELLNFILALLNIKTLDEDVNENQKKLAFIYKFIIDKYWMLTIEEVKEAFKMYVANQFNIKVFRIIDCIVVGEVLASYIEYRNNELLNYKPKEDNLKIEVITNSKKEEINKEAVNRVFNEFKEQKTLPDGISYIYDILVENSLIKIPSESTPMLKNYYDKKTNDSIAELKREANADIGKNKIRGDIKMINLSKEALSKIQSGNSGLIIARTKKLVLIDFFNNKIEKGENIIFNT